MERTDTITYNVPVPKLRGLNDEQRAQALEDYIREHSRQLRMIINQLTEMIRNIEASAAKTKEET